MGQNKTQKRGGRRFRMITVLTVGMILVIALVVSISSAVIYGYMRRTLKEEAVANYEQIFQQSNAQLRGALQDIVRMSAALNTDSELIGAVNLTLNSGDPAARLYHENYAQYILKCAVGYHSYIDNVGIYIADRQILMNETDSSDYHTRIPNTTWFRQLLRGERDQALVSGYELRRPGLVRNQKTYHKDFCIYAVRFNDTLMSRSTGVLLISVDQEYIDGFLDKIDSSDGQIIAMLDGDGRPIYADSPEHMELLQRQEETLVTRPSDETVRLDGDDYFFIRRENDLSGWNLIALVPVRVLYREVQTLQWLVLSAAAVALLVGLLMFTLVARSITKPFGTLMESMNRAGEGNMNQIKNNSYIVEIDLLMNRYDTMLQRMDRLIRQIKRIEEEKRNAQLAALQSQINPHFTYNTLDSIRWVALMQDTPQVAEMISSFVRLLQLTAGKAQDFITVEEEMEQVSCYVEIMKFRYNCRIQVRFHMEEAVRGCRTLKLILQPIVENSFIHGFQNFELPGQIDISACARDGKLCLKVKDDGQGTELAPGALPTAGESSGANLHKGIGVSNVNERVRMWFGEGYGVDFTSAKARGTTVTILQPLQPMEQPEGTLPEEGGGKR